MKAAKNSGLGVFAGIGVFKMSHTENRRWRLKSELCEIAMMK